MFLNKICILSHAQLFLVDSVVIEYKIRSLVMFLWKGVCTIFMFATSLCPASRWTTRKYLNLSAGFAGDDRGRGKHCVFFMAVKDVRNGDS